MRTVSLLWLLAVCSCSAQIVPMPTERFKPWDESRMPINLRQAIGWKHPDLWNKPTAMSLEETAWIYVNRTNINLGNTILKVMSASQWDCWINHYEDFWWVDMPAAAQNAYTTLGYTQAVWDADGNIPLPLLLSWDDITPAQQSAARTLCYTKELWDQLDLRVWVEDKPLSQMRYPSIRYTPWNQLSSNTRGLAFQAGYTQATWDMLDTNPHERRNMRLLVKEHPGAANAIFAMGIKAPEWNAFVTHYNSFYWKDLQRLGKTRYLQEFGWTEETWNENQMPSVWHATFWWQLSSSKKAAATQLGYQDITWDVRDLNEWVNYGLPTFYPTYFPTAAPSSEPSVAPSGLPSSLPSTVPSDTPSVAPSLAPSISNVPSNLPSSSPSTLPSSMPSESPSAFPTVSMAPSLVPSTMPSDLPSTSPSTTPSSVPTISSAPSGVNWPSGAPSDLPSISPSSMPSDVPSISPSGFPSSSPSLVPSSEPSDTPSDIPSAFPSDVPSSFPSAVPSDFPSITPSSVPSDVPSLDPTGVPSVSPSDAPSDIPSVEPSALPSSEPSQEPSSIDFAEEGGLQGSSSGSSLRALYAVSVLVFIAVVIR